MTTKRYQFHARVLLFGISSFAVGLLLLLTNPDQLGPFGITAFFIILYAAVFFLILILLDISDRIRRKSGKRHYSRIAVAALAPILLLALNSLNQLQLRDVILVFVFEFVVLFYLGRRSRE